MPAVTFHADAVLFDMDGTLVDSTAGVVGAWELFKQRYPGINVEDILSSAHGVRTVDNLKKHCGIENPEELTSEAHRFEMAIVTESTAKGRPGIVKLPGVAEAMQEISSGRRYPNPSWAICTSATREYALAALANAGIDVPDAFVAAEDVDFGKPAPDPYLLGASKCGVKPENCVVFEDAPAGIQSGQSAGCKTIGFLTTHSKTQMEAVRPDFLVPNMSCVSLKLSTGGGLDISVEVD
ncbi:HAD-like domain-containing protein [Lentinula detonsa]|uniref:HAD-like domain-containing protein n=1 Tax=Lentinula detonsa TaxID=2804962 RepID=A0A9W8TTG5_9AGAR|nr:HAD-like domain-containing protein [Lentinula detonsa]KAJ3987482.1 HAD-like domain-containing protein [Lentinula detonsa]